MGDFSRLLCRPYDLPNNLYQFSEELPYCISCNSTRYYAAYDGGSNGTCYLCGDNYLSTNIWSTICNIRVCAPGSMQNEGLCDLCSRGKFNNVSGLSECYTCSRGTMAPKEGSTSCSLCLPGSFADAFGTIQCSFCEAGTYADIYGASSCKLCPVGRSTSKKNQSSNCEPCKNGTYSALEGSTTCSFCPSGKSHDIWEANSSAPCTLCTSGRASSLVSFGQICEDCPTGRFCNKEGASSLSSDCLDCNIEAAAKNLYSGFDCSRPGLSVPLVLPGYFRRNSSIPTKIIQCIPEEACLSSYTEKTPCAEGYDGESCGSCQSPNFYRSGNRCVKCGESAYRWLAVSVISIIFVLFIVRLSTSEYSRHTSKDSVFLRLRILLITLQLIAIFPRLQTNMPPELLAFYNALDFTNFNINLLGFECGVLFEPYWGMWILKIVAPFLMIGFFAAAFVLIGFYRSLKFIGKSILRKIKKSDKSLGLFANGKDPYIYGYCMMINMLYTLIIAAVFEPLFCLKQPDGTYSMVKNPSVECYGSEWNRKVLPFLIPAGIIYVVVIPALAIRLLLKNRNNIGSQNFLARFGFLTQVYKREYFWFELVNLSKKVSFILIPEFLAFSVSISMKLFSGILILIGFLILESNLQPYIKFQDNKLSITWSWASILMLLVGFMFNNREIQVSERRILIGIVLLIFSLSLLFTVVQLVKSSAVQNLIHKSGSLRESYDINQMKKQEIGFQAEVLPLESTGRIHVDSFVATLDDLNTKGTLSDALPVTMPSNIQMFSPQYKKSFQD